MSSIFTAYFAKHSAMFSKFFNVSTFFSMWDCDRTITNFHITDAKIFADFYIIIKLVSDQECLKQSTAKINGDVIGIIHFQFLSQVRRNK